MRLGLSLLLALSLAACGDGLVLFSLNSGTVVSDPACREDGGHFDFEDQAGLVVVVILRTDTLVVLAGGGSGSCEDIRSGAGALVGGVEGDGTIEASEIVLE